MQNQDFDKLIWKNDFFISNYLHFKIKKKIYLLKLFSLVIKLNAKT